jgi:hypothetical protein
VAGSFVHDNLGKGKPNTYFGVVAGAAAGLLALVPPQPVVFMAKNATALIVSRIANSFFTVKPSFRT